MKLIVTVEFHDAVEDKIRQAGEVLTVDEARGKTLLDARVCEVAQEEPQADIELEKLTVAQLKELAKEKGIQLKATAKADIIAEIRKNDAKTAETE